MFQSQATNLVPGDTNGVPDIFVKNLATGMITRVDTMADGSQVRLGATVGTISADGRYVAFQSGATDLAPCDTNGQLDIFVKDLQTGAITRVSTAADGAEGGGSSTFAEISANGRFVVFQSNSQEIVTGDTNGQTDIFVKDLQTGAITRANTAADGAQADSWASSASISADGRFVTFTSNASNLVPGDTNFITDVFVKDMLTGAIFRPNVADDGTEANGTSSNPVLSTDGHHVVFASAANNLVPGDTNRVADDFVANACYCTHTLILTSGGEVPVEALSVGDLVVTASGEHRPIRWIGHRQLDVVCHPWPDAVLPVRIRAGVVTPGIPVRDLLVSPGHAAAIESVLVKAGRLVNGATILHESVERVTYWHIELDSHDLLVADGMPAESYVDCGNRHAFDNGGPIVALHPEFDALDAHATQSCLPLVDGGPALAAIREGLIARAGECFSADPAVRLMADGVALAPMSVEGRRYRFCVPEGARVLRLVSRCAVPGDVHAASTDRSRIGIAVRGLEIDGLAVSYDALDEGWHAQTPGRDHRWSDGNAVLPLGRMIAFTVSALDRYPVADITSHRAAA